MTNLRNYSRTATLLGTLFGFLLLLSQVPAHAGNTWQLDGGVGYLFVSDAQGPPWLSDTAFPTVSIGAGGKSWLLGVSADYLRNETSYRGFVPGQTVIEETVEKNTWNSCFRGFLRFFPGGRDRTVATYLGLGIGPAVTSVKYTGAITGYSTTERALRLNYLVSLGTKFRLTVLPVHTFLEGSYGGLGEISESDAEETGVPGEDLTFVSVATGIGITF